MKKTFTILSLFSLLTAGQVLAETASLAAPKYMPLSPDFVYNNSSRADDEEDPWDQGVTDVIFEPQGIYKPYMKNFTGIDWNEPIESQMPTNVVFGENNEVYILNLLSREFTMVYGSYLKGEIVGNEIRVPVPQSIRTYGDGTWGENIGVMQKMPDGEYYPSDLEYIPYTYNATTGEIKSNLPGEDGEYIIAMMYSFNSAWNQVGDYTQDFVPYSQSYVEMPENLPTEVYYVNDNYYGYPVYIGIQGNDMYIKGLFLDTPEGVVKATIDGNMVKIAQNQLVTCLLGYFIWTKVLVADPILQYVLAAPEVTYDFIFDPQKKTLTAADPNAIFSFNGKTNAVFYFGIYQNLSIKVQDSLAGTPSNPYWIYLQGEDYREQYGIYAFNFSLSNLSVEGNVIDVTKLYYSIYIDGDILEFEQIEDLNNVRYPGVQGVVTEMPLTFTNDYDIKFTSITSRSVGIYPDGISTIGIQAIYNYEGVTTKSDLLTLDVETGEISGDTGVETIEINPAEVKAVEFYTLDGRKVSEPGKGIFIKRYILDNGSAVTRKIFIR